MQKLCVVGIFINKLALTEQAMQNFNGMMNIDVD